MEDVGNTLKGFDFSFRHTFTNFTLYKPDGWSEDGMIPLDPSVEQVFHHPWNFCIDQLSKIPLFNAHKKVGASTLGQLSRIQT